MKNIFDFHFHLLFKHFISAQSSGEKLSLDKEFKTKGVMSLIDEFMGNAFDGQSSPALIKKSDIKYGVTALLAMEYAFAENISGFLRSFSNSQLPINWKLIDRVRDKKTSYFELLKEEIQYYSTHMSALNSNYNIQFLNRKNNAKINLDAAGTIYLAFSVEGAHNFSDVAIRSENANTQPWNCYQEIQDDQNNIDIFSINLCHLSEIPEQTMGGFAQGLNSTAQMAFKSADFIPKTGFGLSEKAKEFIKAVFTHKYPSIIDIKHMSVYTRNKFYKYRDQLINQNSKIANLPIISSHTGFTFMSLESFVNGKKYKSSVRTENGQPITEIQAKNNFIGKTGFLLNGKLFSNPWTINLFDEEIVEIMQSNGMIGISMDQRILGSVKGTLDGSRGDYFKDNEAIPILEWRKWFEKGHLEVENFNESDGKSDREIRHIYLLCFHIIHAVRIGYKYMNWVGDQSPWDHICIGSDYDGLINPINDYNDVSKIGDLRRDLMRYIPLAEKKLEINNDIKIFRNSKDNVIDEVELERNITKFLSLNGKKILQRFLNNWK